MIRVLLYLPVIHAGYDRFLRSWAKKGAQEILLVGRSISDAHPELRKETRALTPERAASLLNRSGDLPPARVVEVETIRSAVRGELVILPEEQISRQLIRDFELKDLAVVKLDKTFLRWDRTWSQQGRPAGFDGRTSADDTDTLLSRLALATAQRSSDWWRQVGAVAVLNGKLIGGAHNEHLPSEYAPYLNSDPRNSFSRGDRIDLTTAIHAEASLIAKCARRGQPLEGADLFVSTFPCPGCARLIALSGFRRVFFSAGYSVLEGEEVLRAAGVELVFVDTSRATGHSQPGIEDLVGESIVRELADELDDAPHPWDAKIPSLEHQVWYRSEGQSHDRRRKESR
jgi:dCMP deaminase